VISGTRERLTKLIGGTSSARKIITSNVLSMFGLVTVASFVLLTLAELLSFGRILPYNPFFQNYLAVNAPPSTAHLLGTDYLGRDMLSWILASLPVDVGIPIIVVLASAIIGIVLGTLAGFFRGWLDETIMRLTDMFMAFPQMIMSMAIAATLGASLFNVTLSLIVVWWPPYVRLVRGAVLEVSAEDFVSVSKALNSSFSYIVRKDALPNILPSVLVYATTDIGTALLTLSTLGFLNVGIPATSPELGLMVNNFTVSGNLFLYPGEVLIPAAVVMLIVAGFSFFGEGIRESLDVRLRPHIPVKKNAIIGYLQGKEQK
jgi:peptide/nickel transport system permease protein